jgi:hypothetical protein
MGFLTTEHLKRGTKALLRGRIVTPIDMGGSDVKIAEDGEWYPHAALRPLTEEQIREDAISQMSKLVEGKQILTVKAKGRGVQFVLDDNTRVGLDYASGENLELSVVDPDGERVL